MFHFYKRIIVRQHSDHFLRWKDIVEMSGPAGLRLILGFNDEALRGDWKGHRSSRLGEQFRVIYRIEKKDLFMLVIDLTAHDYRRK
jgi:toxin HigB-1